MGTWEWPTAMPQGEWDAVALETWEDDGGPADGERPAIATTVWVALVTVVTEQLVRPQVNPGSASMGLSGLFGGLRGEKVETSTVRVIGVADSEEDATVLMSLWKGANRGIVTGEELVVQVPFGVPEVPDFAPPEKHCCDCGTIIAMGNRCRPCTEKYNGEISLEKTDPKAYEEALREAEAVRLRTSGGVYGAWKAQVGAE